MKKKCNKIACLCLKEQKIPEKPKTKQKKQKKKTRRKKHFRNFKIYSQNKLLNTSYFKTLLLKSYRKRLLLCTKYFQDIGNYGSLQLPVFVALSNFLPITIMFCSCSAKLLPNLLDRSLAASVSFYLQFML